MIKAMSFTDPTIISNNPMIESDPFPPLESGWDDFSQLFSTTQSVGPAGSGSGSGSGSSGANQTHSNSGLDEISNQTVPVIDERKRRRMISNRESARRSRMRKQKHLENLRNQANRLRIQNRELNNRLRFVLYHCHRVRTDNDRLRSEHSVLRQKLSDINQILLFKQLQQFSSAPAWPCNNVTVMPEQITPPSLII